MRPLLAVVMLAASLALATPATASWSTDPSVNSPVATFALQTLPASIPDGANGVFLVFSHGSDLRAQRLDSRGEPRWGADGVDVCSASGTQDSAVVASDGAGGIVLAWRDTRNGNADVFVQHLTSAGIALLPANGLGACTEASVQGDVAVSGDDSMGVVVVWRDMRNNVASGADVFGQRVNAAGLQVWGTNGKALTQSAGVQIHPKVMNSGPGTFYWVVWEDNRAGVGLDLYSSRLTYAGGFYNSGAALISTTNDQENFQISPDGNGGIFAAWEDSRTSGTTGIDIYAQHLNATGTRLWGIQGAGVCNGPGAQQGLTMLPDGGGGLFVAWSDDRAGATLDDIYAQRLGPAANALWTANGVVVSAATNEQTSPAIVTDGAGGIVATFLDTRWNSTSNDIYAQRMNGSGVPQWIADGVGLALHPADVTKPFATASDGRGGVIIATPEFHQFGTNLYAQRADRYGFLGESEPHVVRVRDVPNDQGGRVKLEWDASYLEFDGFSAVTSYDVFRSAPASMALEALRGARRASRDFAEVERDPAGTLYLTTFQGNDYAWEFLAAVSALDVPSYSYIAATTGDSVAGSNPRTAFMVQARGSSNRYWSSPPDSGYSVDNLAPAAPAPFTGQYGGGATHLHWNPNHEADLDHYQLYRGSSAGFVPGPTNLIGAQPDTGFIDPGAAGSYYKLSAVDAHGNESAFALLAPGGTVAVEGAAAGRFEFALSSPAPMPAAGDATVRFSLPGAGHATLALYDLAGRRVLTVLDSELGAGEQVARIPAAGARLSAGMYVLRIETPWGVRTTRFVRVR